jgi:hypothetical protein
VGCTCAHEGTGASLVCRVGVRVHGDPGIWGMGQQAEGAVKRDGSVMQQLRRGGQGEGRRVCAAGQGGAMVDCKVGYCPRHRECAQSFVAICRVTPVTAHDSLPMSYDLLRTYLAI